MGIGVPKRRAAQGPGSWGQPTAGDPTTEHAIVIAAGDRRASAASRWSAVYLAFGGAAGLAGFAERGDSTNLAVCVALVIAIAGLYALRHGGGGEPDFRATPAGIALSNRAFIPAQCVERLELRSWRLLAGPARTDPWVGLSVVLTDGREVCVPTVTRDVSVDDNAEPIWVGRGRAGAMTMLRQRDGSSLVWSAATDGAVLDAIRQLVDPLLDRERTAGVPTAAREPAPRHLGMFLGVPSGSGASFAHAAAPGNTVYLYTELPPGEPA